MQWLVLLITLIGIGLVSVSFIYVVRSTQQRAEDYPEIVHSAYAIRKRWFATLIVTGVLVTALSLLPFPIAGAKVDGEQVVNAVGGQWYWKLDQSELEANKPVVFRVSSADVNHGFAIYNADDLMVAQVQAMPAYTNELRYTFTEPGKYRVLCLEYCGVAHHAMRAEFTVKGAQ